MAESRGLSRRQFLRAGSGVLLGAGALSLLAACGQPAPPAPAAPKPDASAKPGRDLIGKLEGPEILPDAKRPDKLAEAPMLAELVKAGKLPPVEDRVPLEPMVVKPLREIGKYGGTWRRAFTGPADGENGNRICSTDKVIFWDYTGTKQIPSVAKGWEFGAGGRTFTIFLRKGMKWSDGAPFSADDFMFWYQDIYQNKDLVSSPIPDLSINGKPGTMEKIDAQTVQFKFPEPYPLIVEVLAGSTLLGAGPAHRGDVLMGPYAPAHYLKQFHPKYTPQDKLDQMAKDAKMENWVVQFRAKNNWRVNPALPVMTPWRTVTPINNPTWVLERNPYYYAVDTAGNQLPYIDRISFALAENLEVINLRILSGEYDWQERHVDLGKLPVLLENQQKGNYKVYLDIGNFGSDAVFQLNQSYDADPEIAKWLQNRDFRRALSMGIDRHQLNETFWLGLGTPGSVVVGESSPYNPGPEWRNRWSTLDVKQANDLLDRIGLDKKDAEGYRLRTDGKGRLRLEITTVSGQFIDYPKIAEMVSQHWKKIGIQGDPLEQERNLAFQRSNNNQHQIFVWFNDGTDAMYTAPRQGLPVDPGESHMGPLYAKWYGSNGAQGRRPNDPQILKVMDLFRAASGQDAAERVKTMQEIWKIVVDEQWSIGLVGLSPAIQGVRVVKNTMGNVPAREMLAQHCRTPGTSHPATLFFKA